MPLMVLLMLGLWEVGRIVQVTNIVTNEETGGTAQSVPGANQLVNYSK